MRFAGAFCRSRAKVFAVAVMRPRATPAANVAPFTDKMHARELFWLRVRLARIEAIRAHPRTLGERVPDSSRSTCELRERRVHPQGRLFHRRALGPLDGQRSSAPQAFGVDRARFPEADEEHAFGRTFAGSASTSLRNSPSKSAAAARGRTTLAGRVGASPSGTKTCEEGGRVRRARGTVVEFHALTCRRTSDLRSPSGTTQSMIP